MLLSSVLMIIAASFHVVVSSDSIPLEDAAQDNFPILDKGLPGGPGNRAGECTSLIILDPALLSTTNEHFTPRPDCTLTKRQQSTGALKNDVPGTSQILPGDSQYWKFAASELAGKSSLLENDGPVVAGELKRRDGVPIYLTLSVCGQPAPASNSTNLSGSPPGLDLYISYSNNNQRPGPNHAGTQQSPPQRTEGGYVSYTESQSGDTYVGVSAPQALGFSGNYSYQLTASTTGFYSTVAGYRGLWFGDSDNNSSFFASETIENLNFAAGPTMQLPAELLDSSPSFSIFVLEAHDPMIKGLYRSVCGLSRYAKSRSIVQANRTITSNLGAEVGVKQQANTLAHYQQFYVKNLKSSTSYSAFMALLGYSSTQGGLATVDGGGIVWPRLNFTTRTDGNCQILYNLSFCDTVSYAVPTNRSFNASTLGPWYDTNTSASYQYFLNSMEQIPCNTTSAAKYSLAVTCDDCKAAYKQWLCAVTFPRCADFSSSATHLMPRNVGSSFINGSAPDPSNPALSPEKLSNPIYSSSRDAQWASNVQAGPYKEVLPCIDLCYGIVRACPAAMGFACPQSGKGLEYSYGYPGRTNDTDGYPTCNIPGALWGVSEAIGLTPETLLMVFFTGLLVTRTLLGL